MMPEPQMPRAGALPMVSSVGSKVSGSISTASMAPSVARMPCLMPPPSKAGPAEHDVAISHSRLPMTTSPLVPMSMYRVILSVWNTPDPTTPETMSPPT